LGKEYVPYGGFTLLYVTDNLTVDLMFFCLPAGVSSDPEPQAEVFIYLGYVGELFEVLAEVLN
jgi:hypothetical protein